MAELHYVGSELELFSSASHWKNYWSRLLRRYVAGDVLEVGAGIGANTPYLDCGTGGRWVCLEPDPRLVERLTAKLAPKTDRKYEIVCGTVEDLDPVPGHYKDMLQLPF